MSEKFIGVFQITQWEENTHVEFIEGSKHTYAKIKQMYKGDISGDSDLQYIMNYRVNGEATFLGYESITATLRDRVGRIVIEHKGQFVSGVASSNFTVVTDSCSGDFAGVTGKGEFVSTENGQANYQFELSFNNKA